MCCLTGMWLSIESVAATAADPQGTLPILFLVKACIAVRTIWAVHVLQVLSLLHNPASQLTSHVSVGHAGRYD